MQNILKNIARAGIAGLIIFELLNWVGVLDYTLDFTWLGLIITAGPVWIFLECLNSYFKKKFNSGLPGILFLIAALGLYIDALGDVFKLYSTYYWYDQVAHFIGGTAASIVVLVTVIKKKINLGNFSQGLVVVSITTFILVLYEMEEYLEDVFFNTNRLGPGSDTANDLYLGLTAATLVTLIYFGLRRKKESKPE